MKTLSLIVVTVGVGVAVDAAEPSRDTFPWLGNELGISQTVPPPWTPVKADGNAVAVWGRTVRYDRSLLPSRITSQGTELLASPIALKVATSGKAIDIGQAEMTVASQRPDQVVLKTTAVGRRLTCRTTTTIEFDGMVRIALTVEPQGSLDIDALQVLIPVRAEVAKVYARYLIYDFTVLRTDKMSLRTCTQEIGREAIHTSFVPEIWLGNRQVGLTWAAETNRDYELNKPEETLSVVPRERSVDLVVKVVDQPVTLREPKTIEFALFPTPLKPTDLRMRQLRLAAGGRFYTAFKAGVSRTTYDYYAICSARNEVMAPYECLPWSAKTDKHRRIRTTLEDNGIGYIPYGALWYTNAFHPAGRAFYDRWHMEPVSKSSLARWKEYDAGVKEDLLVKAGRHWDGYRVCGAPRSYADFIVWAYCDAIRTEGIDGIYFDHGELSHSCRNPNHDHVKGKKGKLYYGMFGARELLKRLWIAAKQRKRDLVITQHQSRTLKSLNSFIDVAVTGEAMNVLFAGSVTSRGVSKDPASYKPDYDRIPAALMNYDYLDSFGFEARILPQIKYVIEPYWKQHQDQYDYYSHKMFRHTLLAGVRQWAGNMSRAAINEAWRALDRIGRLDENVTFHPHWNNAETIATTHADTLASYYMRPSKALVIVGNTGEQDARDEVTLKTGTTYSRATDAVTGEPMTVRRNCVRLTVPAGLYRAVLLEP